MARWAAFVAFIVVASSIIAGCSGTGKEADSSARASKTVLKVAMATDIGGLDDDSFQAAAWRGLQKFKSDLGGEIKVVESRREEDYEANLQSLADLEYDLIWGVGPRMADPIDKMSKKLPDQKFGLIDATVNSPNVVSVIFREEEGSYLVGLIAGRATKSKKVGFVGGVDVEAIRHYEAGFRAGVLTLSPEVEVMAVYTGSPNDPAKGKEIALKMIQENVDVIFHAAGGTGQGVIEAAKEKNKFAIGVDSDQRKLAPDNVITSMMKRVDVAVFDVSKLAQEGAFPGGKVKVLGLKEGGVGYSETTMWDKVPGGTRALVDRYAEAIKAGRISIPNSREKLKDWQAPKI